MVDISNDSITNQPRPAFGRLHRKIARWSRWLHIYSSLFSLATILFFSVTGLTLNHPDWFFDETTISEAGQLDTAWLNTGNAAPADWDEADYGHQIDKLQVVEYLRSTHRLSGHVSEFLTFQDECEVGFQGPGYAATARINRATGEYDVSSTHNDLVSMLNDLHKGRHTGDAWSIVIDVSAILSAIVAISGLILVFYLKLNRRLRIGVSVIGLCILVILAGIANS